MLHEDEASLCHTDNIKITLRIIKILQVTLVTVTELRGYLVCTNTTEATKSKLGLETHVLLSSMCKILFY